MEKQNQKRRLNAVIIMHGDDCSCCDFSNRDSEVLYDLWVFPKKVQGSDLGNRTGILLDENELDLGNGTEILLDENELESFIDLIAATAAARDIPPVVRRNTRDDARNKGKQMFCLRQNEMDKELDQYNLHVSKRGMNCVFLVSRNELQRLVEEVAEHKHWRATKWGQLEQREQREAIARLQMKGKTLDEIRGQIRLVNPYLESDQQERMVLDVLLAAAFFVGPNIERLVSFTCVPLSMVADISCRMHDSGLWSNGTTNIEHWFDEDMRWTEYGIVQDCCVAFGDSVAKRGGEDDSWIYQSSGRPIETDPFTRCAFPTIET